MDGSPSFAPGRFRLPVFISVALHVVLLYGLADHAPRVDPPPAEPPRIDIRLVRETLAAFANSLPETPQPPRRPLPAPPQSLPRPAVPQPDKEPHPAMAAPAPVAEAPDLASAAQADTTHVAAAIPATKPAAATLIRTAAVVDAAACAKPEYPRASLRAEETGVVTLSLLIGTDGLVVDSRVERSSGHPRLDEAARRALSLCRFKPAAVDGRAESSWARLEYVWRIE
jgi:periplasmic protein TonB